jgi:hypothetical protein
MEANNIDLHEAENTAPDGGTENHAYVSPTDGEGAQGHDGGSNQSFTLKHLGEVRTVGRDEVIALAQKGLDYDRIRGRYGEASNRQGVMAAPEDETAAKRRAEILEFFEEYGTEVDPRTIPAEVWRAVAGGRTLLAAYQAWELKKLRLESQAAQKATENKSRSAGSRSSLDGVKPRDAITEDWYNG